MIKLSIIIVNYNTFNMTCECLRDIYASTWDFDFEVILVDNASVECNPEKFKVAFPLISLIKSSENCGFARGNNLGIAVAKGEYLLILNSDTVNLSKGIASSVAYMDTHKQEADLGGVGCRLLSPDGSTQISAFNYRVGLTSTFLANSIVSFIAAKFGFAKYRDLDYVLEMQDKEHAVQAMLGAFMLLRRDVIEKTKPLDPDFFMYYEEFEWCYRINDSGFRLMYIPYTSITHIGGGTSSSLVKAENTNKQNYLSILLLIFKQRGYLGLFLFNLLFIINFITNSIIVKFRSKSLQNSHKRMLSGTFYSLTKQKFLLKYFKPSFASSLFPFKLAIIEGLEHMPAVSSLGVHTEIK